MASELTACAGMSAGHLQARVIWQVTQARFAPVDRHHGKTGRSQSQHRRAAGRITATGHDRNFRAHSTSLGFRA
jgi:hypothetical protein